MMSALDEQNLKKLQALNNERVINEVNKYIELLKPEKVYVITDDQEDIDFIRQKSIEAGEEMKLKMEGHTVHYDSYFDQARDKKNTKILVTEDLKMSDRLNTLEREKGLEEILGFMDGAMKGKDMIVRFFSLGPKNSVFTQPALQITDSYYVAHSEDILYRKGYEVFKSLNGSDDFFVLVHSAGELINNVTKNIDKRRIYIDLAANRVLSVNNQYAGNSLGLKKLSLRLAIFKANNEDWLTEHMFVMGIHPPDKDRVTYITGAYPSACGKTSTAMIPGFSIVGDDIAYLRIIDNECRAVNIESGVFGIIRDVNAEDDPVIFKTIKSPRELIFSNVLINDGVPYWIRMGEEIPDKGRNHSGEDWYEGKKDENGNEITPSHPNARYTVRISDLENADSENLHNPDGVPVKGILYGGRDSDTNVPVFQSLNWKHGIFIGATIESETTSATLGAVGIRKSSPMANMDFIVVPLDKYFDNHAKFGARLADNAPKVFATNYFLKKDGEYTNKKVDKKIWLLWAEGRMHGEYEAIETPIGYLPKHKDLHDLFKRVFNRDYSEQDYVDQFSLRIEKLLEKLDRMEKMFKEDDVSNFLFENLNKQRSDLKALKEKHGKSVLSPLEL